MRGLRPTPTELLARLERTAGASVPAVVCSAGVRGLAVCTRILADTGSNPGRPFLLAAEQQLLAPSTLQGATLQEVQTILAAFMELQHSPSEQLVAAIVSRLQRREIGSTLLNTTDLLCLYAELGKRPDDSFLAAAVQQACSAAASTRSARPDLLVAQLQAYGKLGHYPGNELVCLIASMDLQVGAAIAACSAHLPGVASHHILLCRHLSLSTWHGC